MPKLTKVKHKLIRVSRSICLDDLSIQLGINKLTLDRVTKAYENWILDQISMDKCVSLANFGTFKRTLRASRAGINPQTKEKMEINPSASVNFKISKLVKSRLIKKDK